MKIKLFFLIILTASVFIITQSGAHSIFYMIISNEFFSSADSNFFSDLIIFILAGLLLFYIIKIIEMIFQLIVDIILTGRNSIAKTELHKKSSDHKF
jgi:hypothetical protein